MSLEKSVRQSAFIHHVKDARIVFQGSFEDLLPGVLDDLQADRPSVITLLNNAKHVGYSFLGEFQGFQVLSRK